MGLVTRVYPAPAPDTPARLPFFLAYLGLLIALSMLALRFLEQPARRAIRQALRARPSRSELITVGRPSR